MKRLFGSVIVLLFAAGCAATPTPTPRPAPTSVPTSIPTPSPAPTVATATTQDCGTIHMRGPNASTDATAQQSENCFWNAFKQSQVAKLVVSVMGVDTTETHTLALENKSGKLVITDSVERTIVPARTMPAESYTCASLEQQQGGLQFDSCGDEGDFFVPAAK